MSLIDTIVSALRSLTGGSTQSTDTDSHREGQVSVEHDPDTDRTAADTSTEAAVKGTDPEPSTESEANEDSAAGTDDGDSDAVAAGTDAAASTGTLVDEDAGGEPAETVGDAGGVDVDQTVEEVDAGEAESDGADEDAGEADEKTDNSEDAAETEDGAGTDGDDTEADAADNDEPVQTIKGIGPAYAERLETVGIETVGELAAADAASVADGIDVSESRVGDWIERARDAS